MSKRKKILVGIVCTVFILAVTAGIVLLPRHGKTTADIWTPYDSYDAGWIETIEKRPGEDFKILQITDTQLYMLLGDNKAALEMVETLVTEQNPDLVVMTGDNVSALFTDTLVKKTIRCMDRLDVPWAPVFGNHDGEGRADLAWQGEQYASAKNCLYRPGPSNVSGAGNYIVNVTENGNIVQSLIMMDSHNKVNYGTSSADAYIEYDQIAWYRWAVEKASEKQFGEYNPSDGKVIDSMTFFHIAIPEMKTAMAPYLDADGRGSVPPELGFGCIEEGIASPPVNSGLFDAVKEMGSTKYMFFGHDHANSASIVYEGIRLTYGMKTGPSPKPWNDAVDYGGTMITVKDGSKDVTVEHIVAGHPAEK